MIRLGILGSTRGTLLLNVVQAIEQSLLDATIAIVISNKPHALILEKALKYELMAHYVDPTLLTRDAYDDILSSLLDAQKVDFVVLIGYMRILSKPFVHQWKNKIINVHPSLLPAYAGKMDKDVHQAVLAANDLYTGCTVHFVTEDLDAGPIILQKTCPVLPHDTVDDLKARVQSLEGTALIDAIHYLCSQVKK